MISPHSLLECFAGTLEPSQQIRQRAELELRLLAATPGFLGACLDIIASPDVYGPCRQAAAVYFKNRVVRYWNHPDSAIDPGEKPVIKDRILPVMVSVDHQTQQQLVPVVRVLVSFEYPKQWPALLSETAALLQRHDDPPALYVGVLCFAEIARYYRWMANRDRENELDDMISQVFPHLLDVGNALLAQEMSESSAEVLKLIIKTYKFVTYYDLPRVLQTPASLVAWGQFHGDVLAMLPPPYAVAPGLLENDRGQLNVAKCYKWAVANIERLFRRYASRDLSSKMKYDAFRSAFVADFLPPLMSMYLSVVNAWCQGDRWLPHLAMYHLLEFLSHCVTQKEAWAILAPYSDTLVSHLIYPLLCPSDDTLETFDNDPVDYINSKLDYFDDVAPDVAALGLLVTLATKRKKATLDPIVTFATSTLSALLSEPESLEVAKKMEGALRLVGGVSHLLIAPNSAYLPQMEAFVTSLVLPSLASPHQFLQARTLDVCSKFADMDFSDTNALSTLFHGILRPLSPENSEDVSLPVTLESALAIQAFIQVPQFREVLSHIILPTMSKLLELANELDNDAVSIVMQECVENFSEQLQPFGMDLMKNIVSQFMRLAVEVNDAANQDIDDFEDGYVDSSDKVMAAIGLLNTMITVLLSFENSRDICVKLEETFSPVVEYVLSNGLDDFLAEVGELIENSIFLLRGVSPVMWRNFDYLVASFSSGIALMYSEELSQCLKNYMVFGAADLAQKPNAVASLVEIINSIVRGDDEAVGYNDLVLAFDLSQTLVLSLESNAAAFIPNILDIVMPVLVKSASDSKHTKNNALSVGKNNLVIACLAYDASQTLSYLHRFNYFHKFFEDWFSSISSLKRVYDIKLLAIGLFSLANNADALNSIPNAGPLIGSHLALLYRELPGAIRAFEKQRTDFSETDFLAMQNMNPGLAHLGSQDYNLDDFDDGEDFEDGADDAENAEYLEFLKSDSNKISGTGFSEEEEPVYEDPLATTPMDNVNPFELFKTFASSLQAQNPHTYGLIFDGISDEEKQVFRDIFEVKQ